MQRQQAIVDGQGFPVRHRRGGVVVAGMRHIRLAQQAQRVQLVAWRQLCLSHCHCLTKDQGGLLWHATTQRPVFTS